MVVESAGTLIMPTPESVTFPGSPLPIGSGVHALLLTSQRPRPFMILYQATSSLLWYCPLSSPQESYERMFFSSACLSAFAPARPSNSE